MELIFAQNNKTGCDVRFFILLLLSITICDLWAQDEFMIYGRISATNDSIHGAHIYIKKGYKQIGDEKLEAQGDYRLFFEYGERYDIRIEKDGYLPLKFVLDLNVPEGVAPCCFVPIRLSCTLFKPSKYDSLFEKSLVEIKYLPEIKNFNYALDIDFLVEKKIEEADENERKRIANAARQVEIDDSLRKERKYLSFINKGNVHFSNKEWAAARQYFLKAQEVLPYKKYPAYKLEDIKTEIELFEQKMDSLQQPIDTVFEDAIVVEDTVKPLKKEYPPKTPEELEAQFLADLQKIMLKQTSDTSEVQERIATINKLGDEHREEKEKLLAKRMVEKEEKRKQDSAIAAQNTPPVSDTVVEAVAAKDKVSELVEEIEEPEEIVAVDTIEPVVDTVLVEEEEEEFIVDDFYTEDSDDLKDSIVIEEVNPVVTYEEYQDSLKKHYPKERTVQIEDGLYKKVTRVILKQGDVYEVYLRVDHAWGATYYFKERMPYEYENITSSLFYNVTKLKYENVQTEDSVEMKTD